MREILNESLWGDLTNKVKSAKLNKEIEESLIGLIYRYYNDGEKCGDSRSDFYGYATNHCNELETLTDDNVFDIMYAPKVRYEKKLQILVDYICDTYGKNSMKESTRKSIKESSDVVNRIVSEIDKSYWIDKLIDDLDRHYEAMEKAWLKNLDKLSDEEILEIVNDCMGKSKTLVGKSEKLKNKMIDNLSNAYDDYIDDIERQIRIGLSEDEIKDMIERTLEDDIKIYLKLAYNNKSSSNYFMVKFAEDNLI